MKEHCLIALWLYRCVQACLMLGGGPTSGGCWWVLGGVKISLITVNAHVVILP